MNIRIVKRPRGEAPEDVRDAWIGLAPGRAAPDRPSRRKRLRGPLDSEKLAGQAAQQIVRPRSPHARVRGQYDGCVDLLHGVSPAAAEWWRTNLPHLFKPGLNLFFDEDCCVVERAGSSSEDPK